MNPKSSGEIPPAATQEQCAYCKGWFLRPVSLHHDQAECDELQHRMMPPAAAPAPAVPAHETARETYLRWQGAAPAPPLARNLANKSSVSTVYLEQWLAKLATALAQAEGKQ